MRQSISFPIVLTMIFLTGGLRAQNSVIYGFVKFGDKRVNLVSVSFFSSDVYGIQSTGTGLPDKKGESGCAKDQLGCYFQTARGFGNVVAVGFLPLDGSTPLPSGIEKKPGWALFGHSASMQVATGVPSQGDISLEEQETRKAPSQPTHVSLELHLVRVSYPRQHSNHEPAAPTSVQGRVLHGKKTVRDSQIKLANPVTGEAIPGGVEIKDGRYSITPPADGSYIVSVSAPGYALKSFLLSRFNGSFTLYDGGGNAVALDEIVLSPGTTGGDGTVDPTRRDIYNPSYLSALPLGGFRTPDSLALLSSGVLPAPQTFGNSGPSLSPGIGVAGQFAVNGLRPRENNFTVDGSDNNDPELGVRRQGFVAAFPQPIETIAEFQVLTALPDARFGRALGGQINALSRYSSQLLHGTLYGFGTGGALDAANFFDVRSGDYPAGSRGPVPITIDGTLDSPPVKFFLDPTYRGPVIPGPLLPSGGTYASQVNPAGGQDPYSRIQAGFIVEGPISPQKKDTSFLVSYERFVVNSTQQTHFAVPTVAQRGTFNSGATGFETYVFEAGNVPAFPASLGGNAVFSLFPYPNEPLGPYGPNTYAEALPANARNNTFVGSVDHAFHGGRLDHVSARFNQTVETSDLPSVGGALFSSVRSRLRTLNLAGYFDTKFARNISSVFRASFGRTSADFDELRDPFLVPSDQFPNQPFLLNAPLMVNLSQSFLGFPAQIATRASPVGAGYFGGSTPPGAANTESLTGPVGQVQLAGFSPVGADTYYFPQSRDDRTIQIADTATGLFGRNVVIAGVDFRSIYLSHYQDSGARPLLKFTGQDALFPPIVYTPLDMASLGIPTGLFQTLNEPGFVESPSSPLKLTQPQIDAFIQDYVRVGSSLHLSAGIRIENAPLPSGTLGKEFAGFQSIPAALSQCRNLRPTDQSFSNNPAMQCEAIVNGLAQLFPAGFQSVFGAQSQLFSGRAGFAWAGPHRVSIRGGWGLYTGDFPDIVVDAARSAFPNSLQVNSGYIGTSGPFSTLPGIVQPGTLNTLNSSNDLLTQISEYLALPAPVLPSKNLNRPYSMQTALTVSYEATAADRLEVAYVGTLARHLLQVTSQFRGADHTDFVINGTAIYPYAFPSGYGAQDYPYSSGGPNSAAQPVSSTLWESAANSSYNSLQVQYRHRQRFGLELGSSFTFSRSIDNASDFFDTAGETALPQDFDNLRAERGLSAFDARYRVSVFSIWKVPLRGRVLGNWQLSGILTEQSGMPYTANSDVDVNQDGNLSDRLNTTKGLVFNPNPNDSRILIAPPTNTLPLLAPAGMDGTVGRNTFTARGIHVLDLAISRSFRYQRRERYSMTVRAEAFNAFNSAEFGIPVRILEAPAFGSSVSTDVPARAVQLAIKLAF